MANKLITKTKDFFLLILRKKSVRESLIPIGLAALFAIVVWSNKLFGSGKLSIWLFDNLNIAIPLILMIFFCAVGIPYNNAVGKEAARWRLFIWFALIAGVLWIAINGSERHMEGLEQLKWQRKVADLKRQIGLLETTSVPTSVSDSIKTVKNHEIAEKSNRIIRLEDSLRTALNRKCPDCPPATAAINIDSLKQAWTDEYLKQHPVVLVPAAKKDEQQQVQPKQKPKQKTSPVTADRTQTRKSSKRGMKQYVDRAQNGDGYVPPRVTTDYGCTQGRRSGSVDHTQDQ